MMAKLGGLAGGIGNQPEVAALVRTAYQQLGEGAVAVRSSATAEDGAGTGEKIINIVLDSPDGSARFEADAAGIEEFLARTYAVVPAGQESGYLNIDAGLAELLTQA